MISFSGQFPKILMRQGGTFFVVVIISVGSNAVAARYRRVYVFTAALIVFTLGKKKLCPFPEFFRVHCGSIRKFVDRDHCQ
jgi:hypothetical protein